MSNHNYTNYNRKFDENKPQPDPVAPATEETPVEAEVTPAVEETATDAAADVTPAVEETPVEAETEEALIMGRVTNCVKLNVRERPSKDADVLCELPINSEVKIGQNSVDGWYSVTTEAGVEGFCMKDYVAIQQ